MLRLQEIILGNIVTKAIGGVTNFKYKNVDLNILFNFSYGASVL
jgi:hypothetical protein